MPESHQSPFIPGLELNRQFFQALIQPLLAEHLPQLDYVAALLGPGSDVLGYDTARSMDHDWGPRLKILLPDTSETLKEQLNALWREHLPETFRGFSVFYQTHVSGRLTPAKQKKATSQTQIDVQDIKSFFLSHLGLDPLRDLSPAQWLGLPEQTLLEISAGSIYHDPGNHFKAYTQKLAYYPEDIWLYKMACQWQTLAEMEAFPGRCAELNDVLGLHQITHEIVTWAGNLQFLLARQYRPYHKWWGTALKQLLPSEIYNLLLEMSEHSDYGLLEQKLGRLYQFMARQHNQLKVTPAINTELQVYYQRPFKVIFAQRFAQALQQAIGLAQLRQLPLYGAIDQISAQSLLLTNPQHRQKLQDLWSI